MDARIVDVAGARSPELDAIVQQLVEGLSVACARAAAHLADPGTVALPSDPGAPERILADSARMSVEPERLAALVGRGRLLEESPERELGRERATLWRKVDLSSEVSVLDQLERVGTPRAARFRPQRGNAVPESVLQWHLSHVRCVEETGWTAIGSDHLYIGGSTLDPFGNVANAGVHDLGGGWDSGNQLPFDVTLARSNLSSGVGWPRTYYYIAAISVRGSDKLYEFLDTVVKYGGKAVAAWAGKAGAAAAIALGVKWGVVVGGAGGPMGAVAGALIGAAVGYVVSEVISKVWDEVKDYFKGETKLFNPITIQVDIPRHGAALASPPLTLTWSGHGGQYKLKLDPRLTWVPQQRPGAVSRAADYLEVATTRDASGVHLRRWPYEGKWSGWESVADAGISPDTPITLVSSDPKRVDAFATTLDGRVLGRRNLWMLGEGASGDWKEWHGGLLPDVPGGAIPGSAVGAACRGSALVDVFLCAPDGRVHTAASGPHTDGGWAGWWAVKEDVFLPGSAVSAVSRAPGHLDIFVVGPDGRVWTTGYGPQQGGGWDWVDWFPIYDERFVPGSHVSVLSRTPNHLDLFAVNLDGHVRTASWSPEANDGKWGGWWKVPEADANFTPGTPVAAVAREPNCIDAFAVGLDGRVWTAAWGPHTSAVWQGWHPLGKAVFMQGTPIAATSRSPGHLDLFVGGLDGNVWSHAWDGTWKEFTI